MPKVKGSKQENLIVKPHRPLRRFLFSIGLFTLVLAALTISFLTGVHHEREMQEAGPGERQQLDNLKREIATLERDKKMDQLAFESSRKSIQALEQEVSQLNKTLSFYRSIMAPENATDGLQVHDLGVERIEEGRYRVHWVLAQVGKTKGLVQGDSNLSFVGTSAGEERVLSLKDITESEINTDFKFRYFQKFDATVNISEDFLVQRVIVEAKSSGKSAQTVSRDFNWLDQETLADVGER